MRRSQADCLPHPLHHVSPSLHSPLKNRTANTPDSSPSIPQPPPSPPPPPQPPRRYDDVSILAKMPEDISAERPLFGGAVSSTFPLRFEDVSNIRQVPDHQEVFVDPARDESLIFELLDLKADVADNGSATWFLQDLANEQDAEGAMVIEQSGVFQADGLQSGDMPAVISTAVGQMAISKGRQGREAQNLVKVYLANLRLKGVVTDVLITAYEPIVINPLSETAITVGAGVAVPAAQSGRMPMAEVFQLAATSFKVNDWSLFSAAS